MEEILNKAERFLVNVVNKNANCLSFDDLRLWNYHFKSTLVEEMPPTSNSIKLHILRSLYVTHSQITCLDSNAQELDPTEFGFIEKDDLLMPERVDTLKPPEDEFIYACNCKVCTRRSCNCLRWKVACSSFCACRKKSTCKNKFNPVNDICENEEDVE